MFIDNLFALGIRFKLILGPSLSTLLVAGVIAFGLAGLLTLIYIKKRNLHLPFSWLDSLTKRTTIALSNNKTKWLFYFGGFIFFAIAVFFCLKDSSFMYVSNWTNLDFAIPWNWIVFRSFGIVLPFALASIPFMVGKNRNSLLFIGLMSIAIFVTTALSLSLPGMIPSYIGYVRYIGYLVIPLSILAAFGIFYSMQHLKKRHLKALFVVILAVLVSTSILSTAYTREMFLDLGQKKSVILPDTVSGIDDWNSTINWLNDNPTKGATILPLSLDSEKILSNLALDVKVTPNFQTWHLRDALLNSRPETVLYCLNTLGINYVLVDARDVSTLISTLTFSANVTREGATTEFKWQGKDMNSNNQTIRVDNANYAYIMNTGTKQAWESTDSGATWTAGNFIEEWITWGPKWTDYVDNLTLWPGSGDYSYNNTAEAILLFGITRDDSYFSSIVQSFPQVFPNDKDNEVTVYKTSFPIFNDSNLVLVNSLNDSSTAVKMAFGYLTASQANYSITDESSIDQMKPGFNYLLPDTLPSLLTPDDILASVEQGSTVVVQNSTYADQIFGEGKVEISFYDPSNISSANVSNMTYSNSSFRKAIASLGSNASFIAYAQIGKGSLILVNSGISTIGADSNEMLKSTGSLLLRFLSLNVPEEKWSMPYFDSLFQKITFSLFEQYTGLTPMNNKIIWFSNVDATGNIQINSKSIRINEKELSVSSISITTNNGNIHFEDKLLSDVGITGVGEFLSESTQPVILSNASGLNTNIDFSESQNVSLTLSSANIDFKIGSSNLSFSNANVSFTLKSSNSLVALCNQPIVTVNGFVNGSALGLVQGTTFDYSSHVSLTGKFTIEFPYTANLIYSQIISANELLVNTK